MKRRVLVICNPAAGRRRLSRLKKAVSLLEAGGCDVVREETSGPGDAKALALGARADCVVAAGGDGTVYEVANGLRGIPLAVFPLGTANVLSHELGIGSDLAKAARAVLGGRTLRTFPGVVNGRKFVLFAGAGFDAHVVESVRPGLKRASGRLAYVWETARSALRYRFPLLQVEVDGAPHEAYSAIVCNAARYAGPYVLAPKARLSEKGFHVCLFRGRGFVDMLRYGFGLICSRLHKYPDVEILSGSRVRVHGPQEVAVQADGEPAGRLPAEFTVSEEPLDIIVP